MARFAHSEHIVIIGCRSIIAVFIHMEYHLFHMEYHFSSPTNILPRKFGEVKKLAQRDSNPGPSRRRRRQCDKVTITPQGKSQLTITTR